MKEFLILLAFPLLLVEAQSFFSSDQYRGRGNGLSLGFGMSNAQWEKPHPSGGHTRGKVFGMEYNLQSTRTGPGAMNAGHSVPTHGQMMNVFQSLARDRGVDLNEIASDRGMPFRRRRRRMIGHGESANMALLEKESE